MWPESRHGQFLLAFVPWEDVLDTEGGEKQLGSRLTSKGAGWYNLKQHVEHRTLAAATPAAAPGNSSITPEAWMHQYLRPIQDYLTHNYTAVGILEEFNTTMALFNATLHIPGLDWAHEFRKSGTRNSDKGSAQEEAEAVMQAKGDPDIQATLWLDILLYDYAVGVFNQQAKENGLS